MKWASLPLLALVLSLPFDDHAVSQTLRPREQIRQRVNENVLFLMGGQPGATFSQLAHDISVVVNDGSDLRVLPVIGGAAVQNVQDVVFLRNIDMALTTQEAMNHLKATGELGPNLEQRVTYIATLFPNPLQILARADAKSIKDLSGKSQLQQQGQRNGAVCSPDIQDSGRQCAAGALYAARRRIGETPDWRVGCYDLLMSSTGSGICECQAGIGLAVRYRTLRGGAPGDLSACIDAPRRLSGSDREGRGGGYNCRSYRPDFIQLAERHGAIPTDCKVRRCILLEIQRVPKGAASPQLEDGKPGCNHSRVDPLCGHRGMAQKLA